jgi:ATP-binding cassette subfamily B protein
VTALYSYRPHFWSILLHSRARKFLSYYRPYRRLLIADLTCSVVVSAIALILPLCARYITRNVLQDESPHLIGEVYAMGGLMLALIAVYTACNIFVDYRGHMMGALMERDMRRELFDHYQKLSFSFYDRQRTGQLMSRLTNDLLALSEFYHHGPEDLAIGLLTLIGVFAIALTINVQLTLIVFLFIPVMVVYAFHFNRKMNAAIRTSRERIGDINAQVEDTLAGIRVVQSFTNEAVEAQKFARENDRFVASRRDDYRSSALFEGGMIALTQLITIAVIIFGGVAIARGSLDLADLLAFLLYVAILTEPVRRLVNFARLYQEGITGFGRFMDILELEPDIRDAPGVVDCVNVRGHVAFRNVSFRYRHDHQDVLTNVSLDIPVGDYIALVGTSGVGKTTLCSLIPRFYEATAGDILIDGMNIRQMSVASLRRSVGIVHQDVYLFAGTVAENIGYGRPDAPLDAIVESARKANAHDFIMALPHGYDTDIGQRGVRLSGGQKQRLSIARVFLKDAPIIILDEATSALDNESEKAVQDSLEALTRDRTTLVIAHRLSTVRNARRIVVLSNGGIDEEGTHEALMARSGAYAHLYNMQPRI